MKILVFWNSEKLKFNAHGIVMDKVQLLMCFILTMECFVLSIFLLGTARYQIGITFLVVFQFFWPTNKKLNNSDTFTLPQVKCHNVTCYVQYKCYYVEIEDTKLHFQCSTLGILFNEILTSNYVFTKSLYFQDSDPLINIFYYDY